MQLHRLWQPESSLAVKSLTHAPVYDHAITAASHYTAWLDPVIHFCLWATPVAVRVLWWPPKWRWYRLLYCTVLIKKGDISFKTKLLPKFSLTILIMPDSFWQLSQWQLHGVWTKNRSVKWSGFPKNGIFLCMKRHTLKQYLNAHFVPWERFIHLR
jgi:hypothetical protein